MRFHPALASSAAILFCGTVFCRAASAATLTVGPNFNITQHTNNQTETTIAVNPVNPQNLFAGANGGYTYTPGRLPLPSLFYYTTDGGASWGPSDVSALPAVCCDQSTSWDDFGNLFLAYLAQSGAAVVALSTNGGASFGFIYQTPGPTDQPTITTGPGGSYAPGSVWITYVGIAQGAPVYGLGNLGAFAAPETASPGGTFGDIAVGPNGEVLLAYQNGGSGAGPDTISVNLDPDGLGPAGFNAGITAAPTEVGGLLAIPAQPRRLIDAEAGLAWDRTSGPHRGRVYLVYTDRPSLTSNDTDIYLRHSDDSGSTWSSPLRVNDDSLGNGKSQFLPRIALDQTTGNIAVSFYDCRNSSLNNTAEYWATASPDGGASFLPNVRVSAGMSSANVVAVSTYRFDFGDYSGLAFYGGVFYPCWGDNSNSTGNNPEGTLTTLEAYAAAVIVPPFLAITTTTTNMLVLSWPNPSTGFYLQESPTVSPANWSSNSATPVVLGRQKQVELTSPPGNRVYRLFHP
ncbi:MAG TPA: sialidase family protein [Candidatus Dormibacteraeota bacterium]|nr:sialidase family protein [Candidatus Dormibacteraeota bacterium]